MLPDTTEDQSETTDEDYLAEYAEKRGLAEPTYFRENGFRPLSNRGAGRRRST